MRGEIDFIESFTERVALLKGLDESVMKEIAENLPITEGVERLMFVLKRYGYKIAILSGGFTYFGNYLKDKFGIDYVYANELEIVNGKLTGRYLGDVVDGKRKAELLKLIAQVERVDIAQTIAVGDGANDLPMLSEAGLGIAFHAKPKVVANAQQSINTIGLDGVLYFLGFKDSYGRTRQTLKKEVTIYMKFSELNLEEGVLQALDAMRFEECTPVQEHTIPVILEGKDLIGVAQTGTGKTAAYLLPVLNQLSKGGYPEDAINCVIMSPTRELAQQIDQQMEGFSYFLPASSVAVYGGNDGVRFEQEKKGLTLGADVVIATPGRLISHLSLGYVDLSKVSFFILDEADRMLDMGFSDDIMQIVKYLPKERQTIMFSATMPAKIQQLAKTILNNPVEIKLAVSKPAEKIIQTAYICYERQKLGIIQSLFQDQTPNVSLSLPLPN